MHYMNEYDPFVVEKIAQTNLTYDNCMIQIDGQGRAVYQDTQRYINIVEDYTDLQTS